MNCQEFSAVLDEHRLSNLHQDARSVFDAHAAACRSCAETFAASEALARDPIPVARAALEVADLLRRCKAGACAVPLPPRRRPRLRRVAAVFLLGFGGVAFAATALFAVHAAWQRAHGGDGTVATPASMGQPASSAQNGAPAAATSPAAYVRKADSAERKRFNEALMSSPDLPDGNFFPLLHAAPSYPPEAAARKLDGYAIGEFTVTADGDVADVHIVKSSDPVFDTPTIEAIGASKYKPRIVGGRAVPVHGARLKITYRMQSPHLDTATKKAAPKPSEQPRDALSRHRFGALLAATTSCLHANDLNCIELNLVQIRATYPLTRDERETLLRIEGFVQHREGNYERAIAAYRKAADLEAEDGVHWNSLVIVAHIYYEQHEYQPALDAALQYLKSAQHPALADYVFVDRLRQLGAVVH